MKIFKHPPTPFTLFGSHARGEAGPESDLDLYVETESLRRAVLTWRIALIGMDFMDHALRLATQHDLQAIEEVVRAAYSHYVARIGRKPGPMLDDYNDLIAAGRVHVVEHDGVVRGVLVLIPEDSVMLLDNVAVAPAAQGMGLGRAMLAFAERVAKASGCQAIRLYTNEAMTENIRLYSRIGYVETHRAEDKDFRRIYMTKPLR